MNGRCKTYQGEMTLDKAAMVRVLHQQGAFQIDLMRAFGVSLSTIQHIVHNRRWVGQQCRGCWRILGETPGSTDVYCEECKKQFCAHCAGPKSPGRKSHRCATCDRENQRNVVQRHGTCRECGEQLPETRKSRCCADCLREEQQLAKRFRDNRNKVCSREGCNNPLPTAKSWNRRLCRPCANEHDRLRRALSRRQCAYCGEDLGEYKGAVCADCRQKERERERKKDRKELKGLLKAVDQREREIKRERRGTVPLDGD